MMGEGDKLLSELDLGAAPLETAWRQYQAQMLGGVPLPILYEIKMGFFAGAASVSEIFLDALAAARGDEKKIDSETLDRVKVEIGRWVRLHFDREFRRRHAAAPPPHGPQL